MASFKKFPWLSWLLFVLICTCFGLLVASERFVLSKFIFSQLKVWGLYRDLGEEKYIFTILITIAETAFIFLFTVFLSDSLDVLKLIFKKPFASNLLTFMYILLWSFVFTIVLASLPYFVRFLILQASAVLLRIELQQINFNHRQASILIGISGIVSFALGVTAPKIPYIQ